MEIKHFKRIENQPALRASFTMIIPKWGLEVRNILYFEKGSNTWFSFPSKEYVSKEGEKKHFHFVVFHDPAKERLEKALKEKIIPLLNAPQEENLPSPDLSLSAEDEIPF